MKALTIAVIMHESRKSTAAAAAATRRSDANTVNLDPERMNEPPQEHKTKNNKNIKYMHINFIRLGAMKMLKCSNART